MKKILIDVTSDVNKSKTPTEAIWSARASNKNDSSQKLKPEMPNTNSKHLKSYINSTLI